MVPHAPIDGGGRRNSTIKFPEFLPEILPDGDVDEQAIVDEPLHHRHVSPQPHIQANGSLPGAAQSARSKRLPFKRQDTWNAFKAKTMEMVRPRSRQKSLSEAIHTVRNRKASISENAHEIADSLKAPISFRLVLLCLVWFAMSIMSNASSKAILTALPKPVTLTIMQFIQVSLWCLFMSWLAKRSSSVRNAMPVLKNGIRRPTKEIIITTLPLTAFQIGGHILNSDAMARISVALVHTIKGLSPLMTVFAYRTFYNLQYSRSTYLSLIPLTLGVILACSASFKGDFPGLLYAFGSATLFVTQNIVSKNIFIDSAKAEADGVPLTRRKPDKLNLLCYSSVLACIITLPIWFWSEGTSMIAEYWDDGAIELRIRPGSLDHGALALEFLFNGTFFFGQSLVAFVLLGLVSPVTYSVASLIKRVAVIIFAIVWFGNPMTGIQAVGFILTFLGLYLYDRTSDTDRVDRKQRLKEQQARPLLPTTGHVETAARRSDLPPVAEAEAEMPPMMMLGGGGYVNGAPVGSWPGRPHVNGYALTPAGGSNVGSHGQWDRQDAVGGASAGKTT